MKLVLLGPPGAGKGTLAGLLKKNYDLLHISTGDLLREEIKNETPLGIEAKGFIDKGELVPDELVIKLVANTLEHGFTAKDGYMLDGFPRTKAQAESLDKILEQINQPLDLAVYMETSTEKIIYRISGRRIAPKSGQVYHVENRPPKVPGICDVSGEKLIQRPDDNEETVRKRLDVYLENTLPIVDYYASRNILMKIDGDADPEPLMEQLVERLNEDGTIDHD